MDYQKYAYIQVTQNTKRLLLTKLPAGIVVKISYAAVRGQSDEAGAVQRILNPRRIESVKKFTLEIGDFPGVIILNWVNQEYPLATDENELGLALADRSAQIIDGQHRLAGVRAAIQERPEIADIQLPVVIYQNLTARQCADIFLSINAEQKTVPRSLVFDLYGLASEAVTDVAAVRARDICIFLNEEETSPYKGSMKLPGASRKKGGIALSTAVTALKDLVADRGDFERIGATELELQQRILLNYFTVLCEKYGKDWYITSNALMYASGFVGAIDFFRLRIMPFCNERRSFQKEIVSEVIQMSESSRIVQSEVKGLGGKDASRKIYELLDTMFSPQLASTNDLKV